jgi:4-hydroxy-tetrahydrodipicolinate reductase
MSRADPVPPLPAVLIGASGRMGQALVRAAAGSAGIVFVGAIAPPGSAALGRDTGLTAGIPPSHLMITSELSAVLPRALVVIDFSRAGATAAHLSAARAHARALLIGTTGYDASLAADFAAAAREIPLLVAANTSLGVTLLTELVHTAAAVLPQEFQVRIEETHHRHKQDAPSGTALALAAAVRSARGNAAAKAQIPIESHRLGEAIGEHTVFLKSNGEELVLTHRALDRAIFAHGALTAAAWLASQPPGLYSMRDVMFRKTVT